MAPSHKVRVTVNPEQYRKLRGMSTLKLSDETGIPRTTLRRLLKNPGQFTLDQLADVCDVLDIPADAFEVAS